MTGKDARLAVSNGRRMRASITRLEQQPYDFTPTRRLPRVGGISLGYCQLGSSLGPATGTWPSLTPTSASVTVYVASTTALVSVGTQTIYNFRNVTWATGKTTALLNSGGVWQLLDQDC